MNRLTDDIWKRSGVSWFWDSQAFSEVSKGPVWSVWSLLKCKANGAWDQYLSINSKDCKAMIIAGLDSTLDLLNPKDAEEWLGSDIKKCIHSFQSHFEGQVALLFWMPGSADRFRINSIDDKVTWICGGGSQNHSLNFSQILWGKAGEYPKVIHLTEKSEKSSGIFHSRIS